MLPLLPPVILPQLILFYLMLRFMLERTKGVRVTRARHVAKKGGEGFVTNFAKLARLGREEE